MTTSFYSSVSLNIGDSGLFSIGLFSTDKILTQHSRTSTGVNGKIMAPALVAESWVLRHKTSLLNQASPSLNVAILDN